MKFLLLFGPQAADKEKCRTVGATSLKHDGHPQIEL